MTYSSEVLADSPAVYFRLGDASGTAMADSSGNSRNGTYVNTPTLGVAGALSGDSNTAVTFTRTSSQYATFATTGLPSGSSAYTLEAWVKPATIDANQGILSIGNFGSGGQSNALRLGGTSSAPQIVHYWWGNDLTVNVPASLIAVGQWAHIVATWDGSITNAQRRIYVNGILVGGDQPSAPNVVLTSPTVGRTQSTELFNGTIDEAAVYSTALTPARIRAHYAAGAATTFSTYPSQVATDSPIGYWRLSETSGAPLDSMRQFSVPTVSGTIGRTSGLLSGDADGGFDFDGTSNYLDISGGITGTSPDSMTVSALIRLDGNNKNQNIIARADESTGNVMFKFLVTSANVVQFIVKRGTTLSTVTGSTTLALSTKYHVAGTYDSATGTLRVYVNGALDGTLAGLSGAWFAIPGVLIAAGYNGSIYNRFDGVLDEVCYFPTALSAARLSAQYSASLGSSVTGAVAASPSAPTVSVAGNAIATGVVSATPSSPSVTVTGYSVRSGLVTATASSPTLAVAGTVPPLTTGSVSVTATAPSVVVSGDVAGLTSGVVSATASAPVVAVTGTLPTTGAVSATASSPTLTVTGDVTAPIDGSVTATASAPSVSITDNTTGASVSIGATVQVGALTLLHLVTLPGVEVHVGMSLQAGDSEAVTPLAGVSVQVGLSLIGRQVDVVTPDPRRLASQWRYVITDLTNTPIGELTDIEHDPVEDGIGEVTAMKFKIATDSPQHALFRPIDRQCQVWDGDVLRLRGPILPGIPEENGTLMTYEVHDPSWFWRNGNRVITRTPQKNLLHNGDFKSDLTYWSRGYDSDSIPKAQPNVRVVSEDFSDDTDGLDPIKAAEIYGVESVTESELSSNAVFWPNLATFRPGGQASIENVANAMPTTAGLKVTIIGHTANDGTGNGLGLSLRRAQAAAAIIHAKRPGAIITSKGVGFYDPKPGYPIDSQTQRRVVIQYDQTITGKSKQWMRQTVEVTQPKDARYNLLVTAAAMLKVTDDWSVQGANMTSLKVVVRRKGVGGAPSATLPWDATLGVGTSSISDTDPVNRWIPQTAEATVPCDGNAYLVDVYLYAPAAQARYTAVGLFPDEQLYFWGVDQALIFKGVMEHIQDPAFGYADLGVDTRTPLTGIKRDREWAFRDLTPADTALDGLMGISRGIEWDTVTTPTTTTATTFYPRQGKTVEYVLVQGGNVATAVPANTREVGSAIIAQAQGLGSYRAVAYASDTKAFGGTMIQRVITAEQDTPINELGETAKAELFWARTSTPSYWVDIDPESMGDVLANTSKGDTVRLILDYPEPVDALARIVRRQIHPESLRLMLAFEEA